MPASRLDAAEVGLELSDDAHVFSPEPDGSVPWNPGAYTHPYERLAKQASITKPLKNLRHFNATELLGSGVDIATVADRLGHADGGVTTLRVYARGTRKANRHAAEALSKDLQRHRGVGDAVDEEAAAPSRKADRRRKRRVVMGGRLAADGY